MIRQLAFDLPARPALGRADLFVAPSNALALASLDDWRGWPGGKMVLVGPHGAGKTHLAHVWAAEANAVLIDSGSMPGADLEALVREDGVVLEDADRLAGEREAEAELFHLHNMLAAARKPFLLTASAPPRDWGLVVADVLSRMMAAPVARIESPDDGMLSAVLVKLFADRQIAVPPTLVSYLVARMDRSIGAARALVAALDARALAEHRPITRQLAAEVLEYDSVTNDLLQ